MDAKTETPPQAERPEVIPAKRLDPVPTPGRIVLYTLTKQNAADINRRRADWRRNALPAQYRKNTGFQAHIGNPADEGDVLPMLIVRAWGNTPAAAVNGKVFLDGNDVLWVTSVSAGEGPGKFHWPARA